MLYKTRESLNRKWFDYSCRGILSTPPIQTKKSGAIILSMVAHRDVLMYLIAVKSIYKYINAGEIVVLNDGTITDRDIALLKYHFSSLVVHDLADVNTGRCPKGGTWERLFLISEYAKQYYVVQIDSDTITTSDVSEVAECLENNRSFTLGTEVGQSFQPIRKISERMKAEDGLHVQVMSEKNFDKLKNNERLMYARGCSGFAGFAKGSFSWNDVESFSQQMDDILGSKWTEWGSEQVTSNYIVANSQHAEVLPYSKYASYYPHLNVNYDNSSFLHFIGKNRFKNNLYIKKAQVAIKNNIGRSSNG
ncbi:MAG: hypothetical protein WCY36_01710 [Candidatus Omnitrophota bacterium]